MKHFKIILIFELLLSLTACGQTNSSTTADNDIKQNKVSTNLETIDNKKIKSETVSQEKITGVLSFGNYPQNTTTAEPIEWLVLESHEDRVLLLAKDCIESLPWHNINEGITWDNSDIRAWLNGKFLQTAFTTEEQKDILSTELDNKNDLKHSAVGGNTQDKIFLLSSMEVEKYLPSESERKVKATSYAISHGAYTNASGECAWWLRSLGMTDKSPAYIASAGNFGVRAHKSNETIIGVRPAMWVKLDNIKARDTKETALKAFGEPTINASIIWNKYDKVPNKFTPTYNGEIETVTGVVTYIGQDSHGTPSMELSDTVGGTSYVLGVFASYDEMSSVSVGDTVTISGSFHIMSSENKVVLKQCKI